MTVSRRACLAAVVAAALPAVSGCASPNPPAAPRARPTPSADEALVQLARTFTGLEHEHEAVLGVYAVDTGSGRQVAHRADRRFAYASTSKALIAAAVLRANTIDALDKVVPYGSEDLVAPSPITERHLGGMTLRALCDAAVRFSDGTACNLLLDELGGPRGFQAALAALGDHTTVAARVEPALNEGTPGDRRDTSTPRALAADLRAYALGDALTSDKQDLLVGWLQRSATGDTLIRGGLPGHWQVADKSGAGGWGTRNDLAIVWPPERDPVVIAVLSRGLSRDAEPDDALVAAAGRAAVTALVG